MKLTTQNGNEYEVTLVDTGFSAVFEAGKSLTEAVLKRSLGGFTVVTDDGQLVFETKMFNIEFFNEGEEINSFSVTEVANPKLLALEAKVNMLEMQVMILNTNAGTPNLPPLPEV